MGDIEEVVGIDDGRQKSGQNTHARVVNDKRNNSVQNGVFTAVMTIIPSCPGI